MKALVRRLLAWLALEHGRAVGPWLRFCRPSGQSHAAYLRRHGGFHAMGTGCVIQTNVTITDPAHLSLGNNVWLSGCTLFGHGGAVGMLKAATGRHLDRVAAIRVGNNVFIGHQAVVMPGVTIGDNCIIGSNAVVTRDVAPNSMMGGAPARLIGHTDAYVERLAAETRSLPWADHPAAAADFFGPAPADLTALRNRHFFGTPQ